MFLMMFIHGIDWRNSLAISEKINEARADKVFKGDHRYLSTVQGRISDLNNPKEIPFSLNFPAENKEVYGIVDAEDASHSFVCEDFFDAYETMKKFIGPGNNVLFFNNKPMKPEDYKKAEQEVGPRYINFISENGQDFVAFSEYEGKFNINEDGLGDINKDVNVPNINNTSISPALSSVLASTNDKENDEDLFQNIPDLDQKILKQYLNGMDKNNRSFFSRAEKANFLNKWKQKNLIKEFSLKEEIDHKSFEYSYSIIRPELSVWKQEHQEIEPITFAFQKMNNTKIFAAIEETSSSDKHSKIRVHWLEGFEDFIEATRYLNSYVGPGIYISLNGLGINDKDEEWELYYYNKDDEGWKMLGAKLGMRKPIELDEINKSKREFETGIKWEGMRRYTIYADEWAKNGLFIFHGSKWVEVPRKEYIEHSHQPEENLKADILTLLYKTENGKFHHDFYNSFNDFADIYRFIDERAGPGIFIYMDAIVIDKTEEEEQPIGNYPSHRYPNHWIVIQSIDGDKAKTFEFQRGGKNSPVKEHITESNLPSFSTQEFSRNKDSEQIEFEHLLNLIKDPTDRQWIKASIDPKLSMKKQIRQLENYIEYIRGISLSLKESFGLSSSFGTSKVRQYKKISETEINQLYQSNNLKSLIDKEIIDDQKNLYKIEEIRNIW